MSDVIITKTMSSLANQAFAAVKGSAKEGKSKEEENTVKSVSASTSDVVTVSQKKDEAEQSAIPKVSDTLEKANKEKELSEYLQERNEKLAQERMNALNRQNIGLAFSIDKETDDTVVKVTDRNTEKLVRQIPSEEFIELSERMRDLRERTGITDKDSEHKGLLFDEKA
ncbi:MAG: flagellar protein FlaG [Succinivibrio sp.]